MGEPEAPDGSDGPDEPYRVRSESSAVQSNVPFRLRKSTITKTAASSKAAQKAEVPGTNVSAPRKRARGEEGSNVADNSPGDLVNAGESGGLHGQSVNEVVRAITPLAIGLGSRLKAVPRGAANLVAALSLIISDARQIAKLLTELLGRTLQRTGELRRRAESLLDEIGKLIEDAESLRTSQSEPREVRTARNDEVEGQLSKLHDAIGKRAEVIRNQAALLILS